mgnify:CR=1 FL=1
MRKSKTAEITVAGAALLLALASSLGACGPETDQDGAEGASAALIEPNTLYIGDAADNSIQRFDATTGEHLGKVVKSKGGLHGPQGIVVSPQGNLLVADQNVDTSANGDLLLYGVDGKLLDRTVKHADRNAPAAPSGIVLWNGRIFVADVTAQAQSQKPATPGRVRCYSAFGEFLGDLVPTAALLASFHPRGVVIGPDGLLYVSSVLTIPPQAGGQVLRFNPQTLQFVDVFVDDVGGVGRLNRPDGLVFDEAGDLYVTSFRANESDADAIRVYGGPGSASPGALVKAIQLYTVGQELRAFAQALLFGPGGDLFIPITGGGPDTGSVRRYDVTTGTYEVFIAPGTLGSPWFASFSATDPATLLYEGD